MPCFRNIALYSVLVPRSLRSYSDCCIGEHGPNGPASRTARACLLMIWCVWLASAQPVESRAPAVAGAVWLSNETTVSGAPARLGGTVLLGDRVDVGDGAAEIGLVSGTRVVLGARTSVVFVPDRSGVSALLDSGSLTLSTRPGSAFRVRMGNVSVLPESTANTQAVIDLTEHALNIAARQGAIRFGSRWPAAQHPGGNGGAIRSSQPTWPGAAGSCAGGRWRRTSDSLGSLRSVRRPGRQHSRDRELSSECKSRSKLALVLASCGSNRRESHYVSLRNRPLPRLHRHHAPTNNRLWPSACSWAVRRRSPKTFARLAISGNRGKTNTRSGALSRTARTCRSSWTVTETSSTPANSSANTISTRLRIRESQSFPSTRSRSKRGRPSMQTLRECLA